MGALIRSLTAAVVITLGISAAAHATDRRIDGLRLVLKRVGTATKVTFVSRDPDFLFPPIGGTDDPTSAGAIVELFSSSEGQATVTAPAGSGTPGWATTAGAVPAYRFRNREAPGGISPVRVAILRQGKALKVAVEDVGLPLAVPQVAVGIRITTGTLRSCARFSGPAIRRDVPGVFVASHAEADAPPDCSDAYLSGLPSECALSQGPACNAPCPADGVCVPTLNGCQCVYPSSPCGDTAPACSGTCPAGESCAVVGPGLVPRCLCLPEDSTPCGDPGAPICGGVCPSGTACQPVRSTPLLGGDLGCDCAAPGPCGQGGADCPNGFACTPQYPSPICAPIECGGSPVYPICGGTCVSGASCQPFKFDDSSGFTTCLCAVPAPCETCGGYTCGGGEVCTWDTSLVCSCGAP